MEEKLRKLPQDSEEFTEQFDEQLNLGNKADPTLTPIDEKLMVGHLHRLQQERQCAQPISPINGQNKIIDKFVETRTRYDFKLNVTRIDIDVEKQIVLDEHGEKSVITGSTHHLGPPGYSVTWDFLVNISLLAVNYATPFNRIATMLSSPEKQFTAGNIGRLLHYIAQRFVLIYLALGDKLCDAGIVLGDDTPIRVLEVTRYFKQEDNGEQAPWARYETRDKAVESSQLSDNDSLSIDIACEWGFASQKRNSQEVKRSFNTTVMAGRLEQSGNCDWIVFYRSHLGHFGNLLTRLLEKRNPKLNELIVQSDLASVNNVTDEELSDKFNITRAGCSSHSRRPFALYESEAPEQCGDILHLFKGLALFEELLTEQGRNKENVTAVRDKYSRFCWQEIKQACHDLIKDWSPSTKLGTGANYIINHYNALTVYLDEPRLQSSNNFSERMLRMEKLIEKNSMFRQTLEGRFALDVLRSVYQTATISGVPLNDYIIDILKTDPQKIADNPEDYTPSNWRQRHLSSASDID